MKLEHGLINTAHQAVCEHYDERPDTDDISLLVIHNISLPPGKFGGPFVEQFFAGQLEAGDDPFFSQICHLRVSAHLFIRRDGQVVQFVPLHKRAWHAGVSSFQGRSKCNDFSIGIEMEGTDDLAYTSEQYKSLLAVSGVIVQTYPRISLGRIVGHQDIAPGRKTDPGRAFDWQRFRQGLAEIVN